MIGKFTELGGGTEIKPAKQKLPKHYMSLKTREKNTKVLHFQVLKKLEYFMKS